MASLANVNSRQFVGIYCAGMFITSAISVGPFLRHPEWFPANYSTSLLIMSWLGASLVLALSLYAVSTFVQRPAPWRWTAVSIPAALFIVAVLRANGFPGLSRINEYGDSDSLRILLDDTRVDFSRWLLGYRLLSEILGFFNLITDGVDIDSFVRISSACAMLGSAAWFVRKLEGSVVPWLLIVSPIWILFSLGYDEYYPFVAGIVAAASWQIVSGRNLFQLKTAYILAGLLPILYIGAVPLSIALILYAWNQESGWSGRSRGAGVTLVSAILAIEIGGEFKGYVRGLSTQLNLGGQYLEKSVNSKASAASSRSFLADPSYALSVEHAVDIFFWLSCGVGLVVIVAALALCRGTQGKKRFLQIQKASGHQVIRHLPVLVLVGLAIFYLVFMLPLLGPTRDIDLYFTSMFVLLLFAGSCFDRFAQTSENPSLERLRFMQLAAFGFAPATVALVVFGVSR
jgi:hypothetical protein